MAQNIQSLQLHSWPKAIAHLDADAFFASVEQAIHPELKGLPVITGAERGIVAAASYEAKALGIQRGVSLRDVKKIAPHCLLLPSDYETYSLYSKRLFSIIRRFTPTAEEYSIDEAFFDLTGLRRLHHSSYGEIAKKIQETIHRELDITVSVGVSLSKVLAKLASKWKKPAGLTLIPGREIHEYLLKTPIPKVWGFGANISAFLEKQGIINAYQYVSTPEALIKKWLGKIGIEMWQELRGESVYSLMTHSKTSYASISKFKTFTPSREREIVFARLLRNLESACIKSRRYHLGTKRLMIYLRKQNFETRGLEISLSRGENSPLTLRPFLEDLFKQLFEEGELYRATGVVLSKLEENHSIQYELFENPLAILKQEQLYRTIDQMSARFGKHCVFLGPGLALGKQFIGARDHTPQRKRNLLKGETKRQHLAIPLLQFRGV